ncbi:hypothetical protein M514_00509 [Trichuris suis]|uniref:Uncharacterized protein n=1 Tax=Trichuris suis TaxID=68888 RepID=A0A085NRL0_9BILA|nr:hypothetical protein M513_00509 [Trichuris suis]KFD72106.1 hypothetical protein M514_00509 [Trichuris suis]
MTLKAINLLEHKYYVQLMTSMKYGPNRLDSNKKCLHSYPATKRDQHTARKSAKQQNAGNESFTIPVGNFSKAAVH